MNRKLKLAILESHPVHYRTGIWQKLTESKTVDATVYFCSDISLHEKKSGFFAVKLFEDGIGTFKYKFLKNYLPFGEEKPPKGLWNFGMLYELIKNRPDAILIVTYLPLIHKLILFYAKMLGIPILFKEEIDKVNESSDMANKIKDTIFPFLFKLPNIFLYSYTRSKEYYLEKHVPKEKLIFHPCAVDNDKFQKKRKEIKSFSKIKKEFNLPSNKKVILFVGRFDKRKRVMDILDAYMKLKKKDDYSLVLVGTGSKIQELKDKVKKHKLKNVFLISAINQNEIHKMYAIADLFVIVSSYDPCPKVLNEAMNFAMPIIACNQIGTVKDLVIHKKNGYQVNVGDVSAISKYMEKILADTKLRDKMGQETRRIVLKWNYDEDRKAIEKAMKKVVRRK